MIRTKRSRLWPPAGSLALLLLLGFSPWGLWERDEGRYADVAREMLARRDFITPRIDGAVFLDKPPLVYWITATSLAVWGLGETGARCGQILFAAGILLVTRRIGILLFELGFGYEDDAKRAESFRRARWWLEHSRKLSGESWDPVDDRLAEMKRHLGNRFPNIRQDVCVIERALLKVFFQQGII